MIVRMCVFVVTVIVAALSSIDRTFAAQVPTAPRMSVAPDSVATQFVIAGIRQERGKLASGICRFTGYFKSRLSSQEEDDLDGPVNGLLVFSDGRLRFDISRPGWVVDPDTIELAETGESGSKRATAETVKGILHKKFADDKARATFWNGFSPLTVISQSKEFTDRKETEYLDIRGITLYDSFSRAKALPLDDLLDHILKFDSPNAPGKEGVDVVHEVVKGGDGIWSLIWTFQHGVRHARFTLTVDVQSGFATKEYKGESAPAKRSHARESWRVDWVNKTQWELKDGVLVPIRHSWQTGRIGERPMEEMTFDFSWESVNRPVDEAFFDYSTFNLPDDVGIQDVSNGRLVWIRPLPRAGNGGGLSGSGWLADGRGFVLAVVMAILAIVFLGLSRRRTMG